jgi:hypothetical protein
MSHARASLVIAGLALAQAGRSPSFDEYPAAVYRGAVARPSLETPIGRQYRTVLRGAVQRETNNFAGAYTIARWGHGVGWHDFAIISARNGAVYYNEALSGPIVLEYRSTSRLLRLTWIPDLCPPGEMVADTTDSYLWTGFTLRRINREVHNRSCEQ